MGEGGILPNRHITFIVAEKSLIHSSFCSIFGIFGGRGLVENVIWAEGVDRKRQNTIIWGKGA